MRKVIWPIAVVLTGLPISSTAQSEAITPSQIQQAWVEKTLVGQASSGAPVTMKLLADGTAELSAGRTSDRGTWRLSDIGYCTTWNTIRAGQERCFSASKTGDRITVLNPDGSVSGYFTEIK